MMISMTMSKAPLSKEDIHAQAVEQYETALRAMQDRKFEKARGLFEKVLAGPVRELADRASGYIKACDLHIGRAPVLSFPSCEEHFDYAVSLMNAGDYLSAREHMEKIRKQAPKADYVVYGLAALDSVTGRGEESLQMLATAVAMNPRLRYQARNDPDFRNLNDDPRFTELVYPDPNVEFSGLE